MARSRKLTMAVAAAVALTALAIPVGVAVAGAGDPKTVVVLRDAGGAVRGTGQFRNSGADTEVKVR